MPTKEQTAQRTIALFEGMGTSLSIGSIVTSGGGNYVTPTKDTWLIPKDDLRQGYIGGMVFVGVGETIKHAVCNLKDKFMERATSDVLVVRKIDDDFDVYKCIGTSPDNMPLLKKAGTVNLRGEKLAGHLDLDLN